MLKVEELAVERSEHLLFAGLTFSLCPGQLLQVAGPNGAGKTTLLGVVAGLVPLQSGRLLWNGQDIAEDRRNFSRFCSYIGHAPGLKASMTACENLRMALALRGQSLSFAELAEALAAQGLRGYEHTPVAQMSAGQKRRVALARLSLEKTPLWILDEPFTAIDRRGVMELEQRLMAHAASGGMVLFTTHHPLPEGMGVHEVDLRHYRLREAR